MPATGVYLIHVAFSLIHVVRLLNTDNGWPLHITVIYYNASIINISLLIILHNRDRFTGWLGEIVVVSRRLWYSFVWEYSRAQSCSPCWLMWDTTAEEVLNMLCEICHCKWDIISSTGSMEAKVNSVSVNVYLVCYQVAAASLAALMDGRTNWWTDWLTDWLASWTLACNTTLPSLLLHMIYGATWCIIYTCLPMAV